MARNTTPATFPTSPMAAYRGGEENHHQSLSSLPPPMAAYSGGGRSGGDLRPRRALVWPSTPRPVPAQYQAAYGAPVAAQISFAPAPPSSASSAPASSALSAAAALAKDVYNKPIETALAPPVSDKGLAQPARPGLIKKKKEVVMGANHSRSSTPFPYAPIKWKGFVLLILLAAIGHVGACDTRASGLSATIGLFCSTRSATVPCCDALVAAVDVGGISCLCQTASDPEVRNDFLNGTDLLRLYRDCGGRHLPLETLCDLAAAPAPASAPPARSPAPPPLRLHRRLLHLRLQHNRAHRHQPDWQMRHLCLSGGYYFRLGGRISSLPWACWLALLH